MPVVNAIVCPQCGNETVDRANYCHACGGIVAGSSLMDDTRWLNLPRSEYAPVWRRFIACSIDLCLVAVVLAPILLVLLWCIELITSSTKLLEIETGRFLAGVGSVLLVIISDWLYNAKAQSSANQATFGKRFMRVKVTGLGGERIGFGQATGRYFAKFLSTFTIIGFPIAIFTRRKQALHDIVAGTLVLKG